MNGFYIFKWWLLAVVVIAPAIFLVTSFFTGGADSTFIWMIPFGLMFSLPCLVCMMFIFGFLFKWKASPVFTKWFLNAAASLLTWLTFHLLADALESSFIVIYIASIIFSSLFCRIKDETESSPFDNRPPQ